MEIPIESARAPRVRRASGVLGPMLARAADGAFTLAADGEIVSWNDAAEAILGYADREVVGRRCCDLLHAWDERGRRGPSCHGCHVRMLVRNGDPVQSFDAQVRHKGGRRIRLHVSTLVVPNGTRADHPSTIHLFHEATWPRNLPSGRAALAASALHPLTARETEVVRLVAAGASSRVIAMRLSISTATARNHIQHILSKLGLHSRLELVAHVVRSELL